MRHEADCGSESRAPMQPKSESYKRKGNQGTGSRTCRKYRLPYRVVKIQMADARQKCYVAIDDRLPARERIQSIINGGIESKEKVELIRGSSESLAYKILSFRKWRET